MSDEKTQKKNKENEAWGTKAVMDIVEPTGLDNVIRSFWQKLRELGNYFTGKKEQAKAEKNCVVGAMIKGTAMAAPGVIEAASTTVTTDGSLMKISVENTAQPTGMTVSDTNSTSSENSGNEVVSVGDMARPKGVAVPGEEVISAGASAEAGIVSDKTAERGHEFDGKIETQTEIDDQLSVC